MIHIKLIFFFIQLLFFSFVDARDGLMMKLTDLVFTDINTLLRNLNFHKSSEKGRVRGRESGSESESESDSDLDPKNIIQQHIESIESMRCLVIETIRRQDDIIPDILAANERFRLSKVNDISSVERDKVVRTYSFFFLSFLLNFVIGFYSHILSRYNIFFYFILFSPAASSFFLSLDSPLLSLFWWPFFYFILLYCTSNSNTILFFALLCFALLCFTLFCFTLLYFTLLYFTLLYFTFDALADSNSWTGCC